MNKIIFIIAFLVTFCMAYTTDIIFNNLIGKLSMLEEFIVLLAKVNIGYFFFGDIVLKHIYKKLGGEY